MNDGRVYTIVDNKILDDNNGEVGSLNNSVITMEDNVMYTLGDKTIKERMNFGVYLKGLSENSNSYEWEHKLCYKIVGYDEICEVDITGDIESNNKILSDHEYSYSFYDGHMPYYSEILEFEYITFKNKFVCLDCETSVEFSLDDIGFNGGEINYEYNYDFSVISKKIGDKEYVSYNMSSTFINNSSSGLILENSPTYRFKYEACVDVDKCVVEEAQKVYSGGVEYSITPYIGNINFNFNISSLIVDGAVYHNVTYKVTLECIGEYCETRRINGNTIITKEYSLDYIAPEVDTDNTIINSAGSEVEYIKTSEVKIAVKDSQSGLNLDSLKYYIITPSPYYNSCNYYSNINEYTFINGETFVIGEGLNGGYCMYYVASDSYGYTYKSNYYVFYFDNSGPNLNVENKDEYLTADYYNKIELNINFTDYYSGNDKIYYLWSETSIDEEEYLNIKNKGKIYDNSGILSSLTDISKDGKYYLYFLAYDNLNNYKFYDLGIFNIDMSALKKEDVELTLSNMDGYSNNGTIVVNVDEMGYEEDFKCGFYSKENVVNIDSLNMTCKNNNIISLPINLEGEYSLWVYVHDRAYNYSLMEVSSNLLIDNKGPSINYNILKDDNNYHITNEITLNVSDLNGVNGASLKYGWFKNSVNNITRDDLINYFENGDNIGYPKGYYGEYKLYISALDGLGNEKFISLDKVFKIDTDIIRISLIGKKNITIIRGEKYKDFGARAYKGDVGTGGRISEINVDGEVDNKKAGIYYVTYSSGEGDLMVSVTRKVVVKSDTPYLLFSAGLFGLGTTILLFRLFWKKRAFKE
jgi:hypothetical protein